MLLHPKNVMLTSRIMNGSPFTRMLRDAVFAVWLPPGVVLPEFGEVVRPTRLAMAVDGFVTSLAMSVAMVLSVVRAVALFRRCAPTPPGPPWTAAVVLTAWCGWTITTNRADWMASWWLRLPWRRWTMTWTHRRLAWTGWVRSRCMRTAGGWRGIDRERNRGRDCRHIRRCHGLGGS